MSKNLKTILCCVLALLFVGGTVIAAFAGGNNGPVYDESVSSDEVTTDEETTVPTTETTETTEKEPDPVKIMLGDVNMDGKITAFDARLTLRASAKLEVLSAEQTIAADVNFDGHVQANDARRILRYSAKLISAADFVAGKDIAPDELPETETTTNLEESTAA